MALPSYIVTQSSPVSNVADATDLASTANAKGAALIGINDAGNNFTATTVEGALSEIMDIVAPFSVSTFSDGLSSTLEIGTGVWKAIGALTYSATYNSGPPTSAYISHSGWSNLTLSSPYLSVVNTEAQIYPGSPGSLTWTLNATKTIGATLVLTKNFYTKRFWGVSTSASGFTEANIEAFANNELSNSRAKTFSVTPGASEYIVYSYPSRLGAATFTVDGFSGGFNAPETVSVTNSLGYTENYYVYSSVNLNLGLTAVVVS